VLGGMSIYDIRSVIDYAAIQEPRHAAEEFIHTLVSMQSHTVEFSPTLPNHGAFFLRT
jgi:hypothetical protein